ncbi:hypothetical protein [Streptomyces europaeiscabiei]|uniref:hypothetical protein n=1 Tax=Streptomyces europaeiscabiei TaxID=146819 RepID=UPI0029BFDA09|nr:hypothetical protein [Streptomyces europaeiscabiei]
MDTAGARQIPGSASPERAWASDGWTAVPSSVTRGSTSTPPLPSKTPPSAMQHAVSTRYGPTRRRKSAPSGLSAGATA